MPGLEMLEIWNCNLRDRDAGIFRYQKVDRAGNIVWQAAWDLAISSQVKRAWQEVLVRRGGRHPELGVEVISLGPEGIANSGSIYSYLKLKKYVLDGISST